MVFPRGRDPRAAALHGRDRLQALPERARQDRVKPHLRAVPNPVASQWRLEELLVDPWTWLILPNNCAHFVEEVLQAGGSKAGLYSNCPSKEVFR